MIFCLFLCIVILFIRDVPVEHNPQYLLLSSYRLCFQINNQTIKAGLHRIWCGVNRLGDSGVHTLGDTSAFVNAAGQLLLTRQGKTRMDGVGIVFEFYIAPL